MSIQSKRPLSAKIRASRFARAKREAEKLEAIFEATRCPSCGCSYDPQEGINGTCGNFGCLQTQSFALHKRDDAENFLSIDYRW